MARSQILLAEMPLMMEELLRECLADAEVDVLPRGSDIDALDPVDECDPPPIVIVVSSQQAAERFERDVLIPHPQAVILRVEDGGRVLATRAVEVPRRVCSDSLSTQSIVDVISVAPSWSARFE